MTGGTYVTDDDLQELAGRLSEPLLAGSGRRGAILRAMQQRAAAPQGRGDLLPISGPGQDGGGEDDSGLGELVSAITHGTLSGVLREQQARRDFARRAAMEEAERRAELTKFREAQRLEDARLARARTERLDDRSAEFDFRREERQAAAQERRDAARENDERDTANRPNVVMNEFARSRLAEGDLAGAAEIGLKIPSESPHMQAVAAELAQQAAFANRQQYLDMARQLVAQHPVGAPNGPLAARLSALQNGIRKRFAGDPAAAEALANAVTNVAVEELNKRPRPTGPKLVQVDEQSGREVPRALMERRGIDPANPPPLEFGARYEWRP